ncbi:uncharacterized protein LOC109137417 [Larimichthys crocea]|uniref:uncharacterized protein LOC109137417 n=1 Tax=Larimichthys crocea TaxID=215358 RepID=UPI000F5EB909|nr:uncharacterized protein LOC109137417 [Larimichthys crocea]XP_027128706.1 uncharacterized protein LOC109137417 [Larimichthys crocea]
MILPLGIFWLCPLLLWSCISQKGYNIAHGYSVDDEFSSHADVLGTHNSNQFHSGASLNANHNSVSPRDEMQTTKHQTPSLSEEMVQSETDSEMNEPAATSVQKYDRESSASRHPFGLLVNMQKNTTEGVTFPTIKDFKQFIGTMKRSFLMPGSDLRRHFQTAREIMENKVLSDAQNVEGEPHSSYRSNSAKEGAASDVASENEVWSDPMNVVFEPNESLSVPDPVDSTAARSVYDKQGPSTGSAFYPRPHSAAMEHVSSNYGGFDSGGISGENLDIFTSVPGVQNDLPTSYELPEQKTSGSFLREDFSISGHVTVSPVNPPPQDFSYYSGKTSNIKHLTSEKNIQQPKYTPHSKDSKDFQSEDLGRVTLANVLSVLKPPALSSYGKSLYVSAPRGKIYVQDYLPKHGERPALLYQPHQSTVEESKDVNYPPTISLPASSGSVSSSSENLLPQSSSGHVGVQSSSLHDAQNQAFDAKQPVESHQVFTVRPSSSLHGSNRHDGYLGDQRVGITHTSFITDRTKDEETSDPSHQNTVFAIQEPKRLSDNTLTLDSTQSGISFPVRVDYSFSSLTNFAPTSASETVFSRLAGNEMLSRNFGIKNFIFDRFPTGTIRGGRNHLGSFSRLQRQGIPLNGGYVGASKAGYLQTLMQPTKVQKHPANVNKVLGNMAYQPIKPLSASKLSLSGAFGRDGGNTKRLPPQNAYIVQSRNRYLRSKVSQSNMRYVPFELEKVGKHQWRPAPRHYEYRKSRM